MATEIMLGIFMPRIGLHRRHSRGLGVTSPPDFGVGVAGDGEVSEKYYHSIMHRNRLYETRTLLKSGDFSAIE